MPQGAEIFAALVTIVRRNPMLNRLRSTLQAPLVAVALLLTLASLSATAGKSAERPQQDLTFRLINLERQVESLQTRIDFLERTIRAIPVGGQAETMGASTSLLEIQRQMLALAEQQILMQTQLLEVRKSLDRLEERVPPAAPKRDEAGRKPGLN
jgi:hypothetical protein